MNPPEQKWVKEPSVESFTATGPNHSHLVNTHVNEKHVVSNLNLQKIIWRKEISIGRLSFSLMKPKLDFSVAMPLVMFGWRRGQRVTLKTQYQLWRKEVVVWWVGLVLPRMALVHCTSLMEGWMVHASSNIGAQFHLEREAFIQKTQVDVPTGQRPKAEGKFNREWFSERKINVLQKPSQSADFSLIENLIWSWNKIRQRSPKILAELRKCAVKHGLIHRHKSANA